MSTRTDLPADGIAQAFVDHGADICFGVPGGGPNLELIGAFRRRGMRFVLTHSETAACIMAGTYGFVRDVVAPVVVTRGPGATSAVNGAAQATLDRYPLALITDSVPQVTADRVAHQRLDQRALLAPVTKASATVNAASSAQSIEGIVDVAHDHPQGAVHLNYDNSASRQPVITQAPLEPRHPGETDRVVAARRPVVICGIGAANGGAALREALIDFGAPILTTYQAIGVVPTEHLLCAGLFTNGRSERALLQQADLVITVGLDPVEPIPAEWAYDSPVVSLATHPTTDPYLPIEAELLGDLAELAAEHLKGTHEWTSHAGATHRTAVRTALRSDHADDVLGAAAVVASAVDSAELPKNVTVDAGAHFLAVMPHWPVTEPKRLLISNGLATMGFAVPAAIGAALARPDEPVLALVGDGGLGMTLAELETIVRLDLPITVLVFNDAALSLIEIKQSSDDGSGEEAVRYNKSDFAAIARGMGMTSDVAADTSQLRELFDQSWMQPRLVDARIDPVDYRHLLEVTRG